MLKVQEYLRQGHPLSSLRGAPWFLQIKEQNDLAILKYSQIESDFNEPICQECRGLVLYKPTWDVVCFPFVKFFNEGEAYAVNLDETELHIYEKVDGSLAKVWYFEGYWHLSSNNTIDAADATLNDSGYNFQSLFMRALKEYGLEWEDFVAPLDKDYTYMYELATEKNTIVIKYEGYHIYYLGQRNIKTFKEEYIPDQRIDNVKVYNFKTIQDVIDSAKKLPDNAEGYVVRDNNWNRVKIKNPTYFLLHKVANNGKPDFVSYVLENNYDELLAYFPQYKKDIEEVKAQFKKLENLANTHKSLMESFYGLTRKEFAQLVAKRGIPVYLQSFVFKTYENHKLLWKDYTSDWDVMKWKNIYNRAKVDLIRN